MNRYAEGKQMTAGQPAGAPSAERLHWARIDWRAVRCAVYRLQVRIAKAVREGRWGKVKALQGLLTHSCAAKQLAVRRVVTNDGRHTPGIDGVRWRTPVQKQQAVVSLRPERVNDFETPGCIYLESKDRELSWRRSPVGVD